MTRSALPLTPHKPCAYFALRVTISAEQFLQNRVKTRSSPLGITFNMPVLFLTIFISLLLAGIFVVCFAAEAWRSKGRSTDRSALLPLLEDDEIPSKDTNYTDSK